MPTNEHTPATPVIDQVSTPGKSGCIQILEHEQNLIAHLFCTKAMWHAGK
jgi:hypothetical protein